METTQYCYCYGCAIYDEGSEMCLCDFNIPEEVEDSWSAEEDKEEF